MQCYMVIAPSSVPPGGLVCELIWLLIVLFAVARGVLHCAVGRWQTGLLLVIPFNVLPGRPICELYGYGSFQSLAARCVVLPDAGGSVCEILSSVAGLGRRSVRAYTITYSAHQHAARLAQANMRAHAAPYGSQRAVGWGTRVHGGLSGGPICKLIWLLKVPAGFSSRGTVCGQPPVTHARTARQGVVIAV